MSARISILIADTQRLFASALATALAPAGNFDVIEPVAETWVEAEMLIREAGPDVALADYWMPDAQMLAGGAEPSFQSGAIRRLSEGFPPCRLIVTSGTLSAEHLRAALSAGAAAFLPKSLTVKEVADAVQRVHSGTPLHYSEELFRLSERLEKRLDESTRILEQFATLTPPELEVLIRRGAGHSPDAIAKGLYVSRATVNARVHSILSKTGARTMAEALAKARVSGLLQD